MQSTLTFAGIDAIEELPSRHGSAPYMASLPLILAYGLRERSRRPWKMSRAIPTSTSMSSLVCPLQSPINSIRASCEESACSSPAKRSPSERFMAVAMALRLSMEGLVVPRHR